MKAENLKQLLRTGNNVHEFQVIEDVKQLIEYSHKNPCFTIRFDRDYNYYNLPFMAFDHTLEVVEAEGILAKAKNMGCTLVCSNGKKYDPIQICNFVYSVRNGQFILEVNFDKVPLRQMYNENLITISGHIFHPRSMFSIRGQKRNLLSGVILEKILGEMIRHPQTKFTYEGTLYPFPVGVLNQQIVCWQMNSKE